MNVQDLCDLDQSTTVMMAPVRRVCRSSSAHHHYKHLPKDNSINERVYRAILAQARSAKPYENPITGSVASLMGDFSGPIAREAQMAFRLPQLRKESCLLHQPSL
jgi:hypothetical protein